MWYRILERLRSAPHVDLDQLQPTGYAGYVLDCLEAAVRMIFEYEELDEALVQLVKLGGETDTMAAVCGGAGGALHGPAQLREYWLDKLLQRKHIERVAHALYELRHQQIYAKPGLPEFTYSKVTEQVMAGRNPLSHKDIETLRDEGVTEILDLREQHEWSDARKFGADARGAAKWCRMGPWDVPIPDTRPPSPADLDRAWDILHAQRDGIIYVHCRAGKERTAAILTAWLAREEQLSYRRALARLKKRGHFSPLPGQEKAVRDWLRSHRS